MQNRSSIRKNADVSQLARYILDETTAERQPRQEVTEEELRHEAARILGSLGGKKGGKARAKKLSKQQRAEIARIAARSRWEKRSSRG